MPILWIVPVLTVLFVGLYRLLKVGSRPSNYPPGPPTLPIIGNLHQIPFTKRHLRFQKWAQEYGPIYSLVLGTRIVIVLSSDEAVKDLLDKRGNIYSSRPDSYITNIAGNGMHFAMMPYNDTWKMCHRVFANSLNARAALSYLPYQDLENKQMMYDFLETPEHFRDHIRRYTYSVTAQMVFGLRAQVISDPKFIALYHQFEQWAKLMGEALALLPDIYPVFRFLPDIMLSARPYAKSLHKSALKLFMGHWLDIKSQILSGSNVLCFAKDLLKAQEADGFSDELASYICGVLLVAGSDTTAAELVAFVQALLLFPDVQKKAQEELDRVCGDRYPTKEDAEALPYICSCIKEVCRWMPTPILGIPHCVMKDDEYKGYKIPKNATVMYNVWAIHMDPQRHSNPRSFDPSRYSLDQRSARESASCENPKERDHFLFGAGRRVCMGMEIAENSFFLGMARMVWAFNFEKALDIDGNQITPDPEDLVGGLAASPTPFPARITPRSEKRAEIVRQEWKEAEKALDSDSKQWKEYPQDLRFGKYKPSNKKT